MNYSKSTLQQLDTIEQAWDGDELKIDDNNIRVWLTNRENRQYNGDYVIDLDMWVRLLDQGKALFIAKHLSAFRISKTSWTSSLTKSQFKTVRAFDLQITKNNPEIVKQNDLRLGLANNILRTFIRQFASKVILFVDKFFGSTR